MGKINSRRKVVNQNIRRKEAQRVIRKSSPKRQVVRVFNLVRHSTYDRSGGFRQPLNLAGVGVVNRVAEIAAKNFVNKVKGLKSRGIIINPITSPTTRTIESEKMFLQAFRNFRVGKSYLSTHSRIKRTKIDPRVQEFFRKDIKTENTFRRNNSNEITEIKRKWRKGEKTGLEPKEEIDKRFRFILDRIRYSSKQKADSPIQMYHITTHGWVLERLLEKLTRKKMDSLGGDFSTGEGFQVFVYSDGSKELRTLRKREDKSQEISF